MTASLPSGYLADLSAQLAMVSIKGVDSEAFLQGQLSNDVRRLRATSAQLSCYSSPKGRMLALGPLVRLDEQFLWVVPVELVEPVIRRLRMFVLRSAVTLQRVDGRVVGLSGATAQQWLQSQGLTLENAPFTAAQVAGGVALRWPGAGRCLWLTTESLTPAAPAADAVAAALWRRDDILDGIPQIFAATQDHFVAQMVNLDWLGGISFDKGCYTGQEIIARLHYLGQLKRRMFLCHGHGIAPLPGADVHGADSEQAVGEIVDACADEQGGFVASLVLQIKHSTDHTLRVGDASLDPPTRYAYLPTEPASASGNHRR